MPFNAGKHMQILFQQRGVLSKLFDLSTLQMIVVDNSLYLNQMTEPGFSYAGLFNYGKV